MFSSLLAPFGFNYFAMFTPDLMHEFELGVWRSNFMHILRILYALPGDGITILNRR